MEFGIGQEYLVYKEKLTQSRSVLIWSAAIILNDVED